VVRVRWWCFSEVVRRRLPPKREGLRKRREEEEVRLVVEGLWGSGPEWGTVAASSGPESCAPRSMGPERKSGPEERLEVEWGIGGRALRRGREFSMFTLVSDVHTS
jgi:hypothetical protein